MITAFQTSKLFARVVMRKSLKNRGKAQLSGRSDKLLLTAGTGWAGKCGWLVIMFDAYSMEVRKTRAA
jgi:hypothetical protein